VATLSKTLFNKINEKLICQQKQKKNTPPKIKENTVKRANESNNIAETIKERGARLTEKRDLWTRRQRPVPKKQGEVRLDFGTEHGLSCGIIVFSAVCES
jgi:hypothetical protein